MQLFNSNFAAGNQSTQPSIMLKRLDIYESGTYGPQFRRPIDSTYTMNTSSRLEEITQGGSLITTGILGHVASDIIVPSSQVEGEAEIARGWGEKKFRFLMELEITNAFGGFKNRKVITGWTNHMGISNLSGDNSVKLDPNMMMWINTDMTLRDVQVPDPTTGVMRTTTTRVNADQVLQGRYEYGGKNGCDVSIRPEDVAASIGTGSDVIANAGLAYHNTYAQFAGGPLKYSSRSNQSPTHYLHKILKSYNDAAMHGHGELSEDGYDEVMINTQAACKERLMTDDAFVFQLKQCSDFIESGYFTMGTLMQMFPNVDAVTTVHKYGGGRVTVTPPVAGDSASMDNSDATAMVMARICNSLPSMMFDCLLGSVGVLFTNDVPGSQPQLTPINQIYFGSVVSGLDMNQALGTFQSRFLSEIAPVITHQNQVSLTVKILSNVFGNTELLINYNNTGEYKYNVPSFCDAVMSPLVTLNQNKTSALTRDIQNIIGTLGGGSNVLSPGNFEADFKSQWAGQPATANPFPAPNPIQVGAGNSKTLSLF